MGEYWHSFPLFFSGVLVRPLLGFVRVLSQQVKLLIWKKKKTKKEDEKGRPGENGKVQKKAISQLFLFLVGVLPPPSSFIL